MSDEFEIRRINEKLKKMYNDVSERYVNKLEVLLKESDDDLRDGVNDIINTWKGTQ